MIGACAIASIVTGRRRRDGSLDTYTISSRMIGCTSRPRSSIGSATMPASSSPSRTASTTSDEFWPTIRTRTFGWRRRNSVTMSTPG